MKKSSIANKTRLKYLALLVGSVAGFGGMATKADAFFGPVCIPHLINCNCTFLMPCPVFDVQNIITTAAWRETLKTQKKRAEEMTTSFTTMSRSLACNTPGSLPGLNAVGLDINAILRQKIPNLNISTLQAPGLDSLKRQMESINLDSNMLQGVLDKNITPDQFLEAAQKAGVNLEQLNDIGIGLSTLGGLAEGDISKLVETGMSRIDQELGKMGMQRDSLQKLASGQLDVDTFLQSAQDVNLSPAKLADMGIKTDMLHDLASGKMAKIGLPGVDPLTAAMPRISLDQKHLQAMLSGEVSPANILKMAKSAGLSPSTLQTMGVSPSTLQSLNAGAMNPQQLLEISGALNIREQALGSLGITPDLIENISLGRISPNALSNIAQGAGLKMPDLQKMGLDPSSLQNMIKNGPTGFMKTIQQAGMGNPVLSSLGIDASVLGKIASGEIPADQINNVLSSMNIPADSLVIPGLDGAKAALEGVDGTLNAINDRLSQANTSLQNMVNLPIPSIPGLGNILQACGSGVDPDIQVGGGVNNANASGQTGTGNPGAENGTDAQDGTANPSSGAQPSGADSPAGTQGTQTGGGGGNGVTGDLSGSVGGGAACMPNRPLISTSMPPHEFTADVAELDYALAGSEDILNQMEAIADAQSEVPAIYANAKARSIVLRPLLVDALDSIKGIEEQMALVDANGTPEEAWRLNSAIKSHIISVSAEMASLSTFLTTLDASKQLSPRIFNPLPIFPHDSKWEEMNNATVKKQSEERKKQTDEEMNASRAYNDYHYQVQALYDAHEMARQYNQMAAHIPELVEITKTHEKQKDIQYYMEGQLKNALKDLYVDPEAAWKILEGDLKANAGNYSDANKWGAAEARATSLSAMLTASQPTTRYGKRILVSAGYTENSSGGRTTVPPVYSSTPRMPFSYSYVDSRVDEGDPMQVEPPQGSGFTGERQDDRQQVVVPVMSGGIQTYLATTRRESHWGTIRRGNVDNRTTSREAWNELLDQAPGCLQGPLPTTAINISKRPELFDISPTCDHLVWTNGDAEDYIKPTEFGGTDSILWQTKIDMDQAILKAGAQNAQDLQPALARRAQEITNMEREENIQNRLNKIGYESAARHVGQMKQLTTAIGQDKRLELRAPFPLIAP